MKFNTTLLFLLMLWATPTPVNAGLWSSIRNSALITAILGKTHTAPVTNQTRLPVIEEKLSLWQRMTNFFGWRSFGRAQQEQDQNNRHSTQTSVNASAISPEAAHLLSEKLNTLRKKYEQQEKQKALAALQGFENHVNEFSRRLDAKLTTSENKIEDLAKQITILKKSRSLIPQLPVVVDQPGLPAPRGPQIDQPAYISATHALQSNITGQSAGLLQSVVGEKCDQPDPVAEEFAELSHTPSPDNTKREAPEVDNLLQIDPCFYKEQVAKGREYADAIYENRLNDIPTESQEKYLSSIISIGWHLYDLALQKGQGFVEGTFVVEDRNFRLYNFLMEYSKKVNPEIKGTISDPLLHQSKNPFAYSRDASHYVHLKNQFRPYGIDIRFGADKEAQALLPAYKRHILYGKIDEDGDNLIYIKFENFGISEKDVAKHTKEYLSAQLGKNNFFARSIRTIASSFNYIIPADSDGSNRKERLLPAFIDEYNAAIAQEPSLTNEQKKLYMGLAHLEGFKCLYFTPIRGLESIQALREKYEKEPKKYDHMQWRTGLEVIHAQNQWVPKLAFANSK